MRPSLVEKYAAPVPRYTSYPTAPHFTPDVDAATYGRWLGELDPEAPVSLYTHVPFCDTLCWYCGCSTKAVQRYAPVGRYIDVVLAEIASVARKVPSRLQVSHVHWGGGSPNALVAADMRRLGETLREHFMLLNDAEFAVEIDPRQLAADQVEAMAAVGVNRISIGVQDFDDRVQKAINRIQTFATTRDVVDRLRAAGIGSINIDLVYGLPHQTVASVERTIGQVLELAPDRIAIFGYAHLPQRFSHQKLIPDDGLPGPMARFEQSQRLADILVANGYRRIGLDHFARPGDALADGSLHRNFQGYTTDEAGTLIGFGASAIGKLPQGYVQNAVANADYARRIAADGLATVRGRALSLDDRIRALTIERLMCDMKFPAAELCARFGEDARPVLQQARDLVARDPDGLVVASGDGFEVTETGRPFIRTICAGFDAYLTPAAQAAARPRHSAGV